MGTGSPVNAVATNSAAGVFTYNIASVTGNISFSAITGIEVGTVAGEPISTVAQFISIFYTNYDANRSKSYYLTNDLDFEGVTLSNRFTGTNYNQWRASETNAFMGVLDGQGHALKNFKIDMPFENSADAGLFPQLGSIYATQADVEAGRNGTVRNLRIIGAELTAYQRSGIIAGVSLGLVENCYFEATVTITGTAAWASGGIVVGELGNDAGGGAPVEANLGIVRHNVVNSTANAKVGGITGYMKATGSTAGGDNIRENFIVTDTMTVKNSYSGVADQPAQLTNRLFEMSGIGSVNFSVLDTDFWTLTTGSLPTLKILSN